MLKSYLKTKQESDASGVVVSCRLPGEWGAQMCSQGHFPGGPELKDRVSVRNCCSLMLFLGCVMVLLSSGQVVLQNRAL